MASSLYTIYLITFIFLCAHFTNALYEDQVGKFDWKRSFIGKVKQARYNNNRLIVTTQENVIASLNLKKDQIFWRHTLEDPKEHQPLLLNVEKDVLLVTGSKTTFYVRGWEPLSGSILFEWSVVSERPSDSFWVLHDDTLAHVALIVGSHFEVTHYNARTGELRWKTRKLPANWTGGKNGKCVMANPYLVCLHEGALYWFDVLNDEAKIQSKLLKNVENESNLHLLEFEGPNPSVLLANENKAKLLQLNKDSITMINDNIGADAICIENMIYQLEANLNNPEKLIKVKSVHLTTGQEGISIDVDYPLGLGGPFILAGQCRGTSCDLLLSSTDSALILVRLPEGKVIWTREEALSNIVAVEFLELPVSELDASIENEFDTTSDIINMFLHRISTQTRQLYNLFFSTQLLGGSTGLVRDDFGLHRMIVVATKAGKLFGIDTLTGAIVWTYRLPNVAPFNDVTMSLLVQRTARYAPLPAQCLLLAQDVTTGMGVVFQFDPISGLSTRGVERLSYRVKQALLLPHDDGQQHIKPVILIGADDTIHSYPENERELLHRVNTFFYLIDGRTLKGYKVEDEFSLRQTWNVNLGVSEIIAISTRPVNERVHSQGRVLPDRSVYYKYVNPNLIAVATLSSDPIHKHVLSVYLIDGVTGLVIYSTSHKRAKGPVHLVHSENWLVYTFFNERFRRQEIVATEMYEGHVQSNSTAFSSFGVSHLPHIKSQSYILPTTPVTMSVTLTERGITNKFLLVGISTGAVIEIPWIWLQPRFEDVPCGPEESCVPYMPEIPLPPEAIINYNQTLQRMRKIEVAPAKLESTCHVLVHGLDMFYTRMAPSKTFDLLKEDFDHTLIVLVLSGLVIASYVTRYLAAKKTQRQAWK